MSHVLEKGRVPEIPPVMSGKTDRGLINKHQNTGPTDQQTLALQLNMKCNTMKSEQKQFSCFKTGSSLWKICNLTIAIFRIYLGNHYICIMSVT